MDRLRLDKLVADRAGLSRKDAKSLIRRGLVLLNGVPVPDPDRQVGEGDRVVAGGRDLGGVGRAYLMLNKPAGVLCATRDPVDRTVLDLLPAHLRRKGLFPAGRLDKDTEGLVLITDDGGLAHRVLAPKNRVPKIYFAILNAPVEEETLIDAFNRGVSLGGGEAVSPARLRVLENGPEPRVELIIYEGIYHQVKRMFALFGLKVLYLRRDAIGALRLDSSLAPGQARPLSEAEVGLLERGEG